MNAKFISLLLYFFEIVIAISIADSVEEEWIKYKKNFNKKYEVGEEVHRKKNFENNFEKIKLHNQRFADGKVLYKLGINKFADMNETEISSLRDTAQVSIYDDEMPSEYDLEVNDKAPASCDWTKTVSEMIDAGECSRSDWAFTAVGALEGQLNKNKEPHDNMTQLSGQELIECSRTTGNHGCNGGTVRQAFNYIEKYGISTEISYPYSAKENACKKTYRQFGIPKGTTIGYKRTAQRDEENMKYYLYDRGPLVAQIDTPLEFFLYAGGIFTGQDCKENGTFYNILVVGYNDTEKSKEFWTLKNWHGKEWGENGYIRILRNNNTCGIADQTRYINIES